MVPKSTIIFFRRGVERRDYLVGFGLTVVKHPQGQGRRSYAFHGIE